MTVKPALLRIGSVLRPGGVLGVFAVYAAGWDLSGGNGLVAAILSPAGMALLVLAAIACAASAARVAASSRPPLSRAARASLLVGGALLLASVPASLHLRTARTVLVWTGAELGEEDLPGLPRSRVRSIRLAPSGPLILSKTVEAEIAPAGAAPVQVGLFPPAALGPWRLTVFRFGYAPGIEWSDEDGRPLASGYLMLGTFPRTEEESKLVDWAPQPNVMMGVGTFPPILEDLITPPGAKDHLFVRLDAATLGGMRRNLREPDVHRYVLDGPPEDPLVHVEVFRDTRRLFEGRIRAGEEARYPGGRVRAEPEVEVWAELLAVRDAFLLPAQIGLAALALSPLLGVAAAAAALVRWRRR